MKNKLVEKTRVTHIITGLGGGGAEAMLYKLLLNTNQEKFHLQVISMTDMGVYGELIENELKIPVYTLNIKNVTSIFKAIYKGLKLCSKCDVIQTWMYHANLFGLLIGKVLRKKIIWGLHHSDLSKKNNKSTTILIAKMGAFFSKFVNYVVSCGDVVKKVHVEIGYKEENNIVIPNGFDTFNFSPKMYSNNLKSSLGIREEKKVILHVARWDPLKDYNNLLNGIAILKKIRADFTLILVGKDIDHNNKELINLIQEYDVEDVTLPLGRREDIPLFMASADVFVSSSSAEGFPNVIGEAMASGTYCVVTDAGDSGYIVGDFGTIVPVSNPAALADSIHDVLNMSPIIYRQQVWDGRQRIIDKFDIKSVANEYEKLY